MNNKYNIDDYKLEWIKQDIINEFITQDIPSIGCKTNVVVEEINGDIKITYLANINNSLITCSQYISKHFVNDIKYISCVLDRIEQEIIHSLLSKSENRLGIIDKIKSTKTAKIRPYEGFLEGWDKK